MDMEFGELRFCYPDIVPSEGLSLLAALPKTGKSWLALNFAKHMDKMGYLFTTLLLRTMSAVSSLALQPYSQMACII